MSRIWVLVVDATALMRACLSEGLRADPALEVVGTASNASIARTKLEKLLPDLVIYDLEPSEREGFEFLRAARETWPRLRVLGLLRASSTPHSAGLEPTEAGRVRLVRKPEHLRSRAELTRWAAAELLTPIRALCAGLLDPALPASPRREAAGPAETGPGGPTGAESGETHRAVRRIDALVIGASTGGPNALAALLPHLGADLPVPVLIVQHMPPTFTRFLADRLGRRTRLNVAEAVAGSAVRTGDIWIAPGDRHLTVERRGTDICLAVNQEAPENSCRPSADVLFRSAAQVYGAGVLAVVLTGMGRDGMLGCEEIRRRGGHIIVQDPETSVVWGMPGAVARAGLADQVLPLDEIGRAVEQVVWTGRRRRPGASEEHAA